MTKEYLELYLAKVAEIKGGTATPEARAVGLIRLRDDIVNMALNRELQSPNETGTLRLAINSALKELIPTY